MGKLIFLSFLILSAILSQRTEALSDNNSKKSSGLLIRKKRLIDRTRYGPHEDGLPITTTIQEVPYIVELQKNGIHACGGGILSANVILTVFICVLQSLQQVRYTVRSGSSLLGAGRIHSVLDIRRNPAFSRYSTFEGNLALLIIDPPIDLVHTPNRKIPLYNATELLPPRTPVTYSGWGCVRDCRMRRFGEAYPFAEELRSISVYTFSLERCRRAHSNDPEITSKVICTHDHYLPRHCSYGDEGAPLVVNANGQLVGVLSTTEQNPRIPDVFINLAYPQYNAWIHTELAEIAQSHPVVNC